ncbi:NFACT family protein [Clostridium sp. WLY-B-L2]|uniref:Rqc2 homolog RqcH n=1 Tax=Clostridium aromativorans TaxID=2836848 RepID=A0ABS8N2X3_9CLOT|nr:MULTISPECIES: NFACT RNA binding domain-containing protein [Clostridium]KAA8676157.1 fibronectin/fibrinogen-binding protein [Clostridium sp. HV4-5-A1G]MCC9294031.1 NFACT family protein [Clostridium aromativorans]
MALDGIFIYSILEELKCELLGGRIEKVNQPEKDEILLTMKNNRKNYKLSISSSPIYPKIHITDKNKPNPLQPPMFCMVLRKYLNSSKLINIRQLDTDRVVFLDFESSDELGFNSIYTLIVEIMGRHSNITLIRQRDNLIMDSIKHITPEINTVRSLFPGIKYIFPPTSNKLNPFRFSKNEFKTFIQNRIKYIDKKFFSSTFTGVSSSYSKELFHRLEELNLSETLNVFDETSATILYGFSNKIFNKLKNHEFSFVSYKKGSVVKDFYCDNLTYLDGYKENLYSSPSKLVEEFYFEKDKADRLNNRSSDLQKLVNINLDRCHKKINILNQNIKDALDKDVYRICGELLTSNIYKIKKGLSHIKVQNYYNNNEYLDIKLDENKTPSENIQHYFKKYNKLKKTKKAASEQLSMANEELEYLNSVITNIKNLDNYEDIEEIKRELMATGYIKLKKSNSRNKSRVSKPMKFLSSDGIEIYVGKNNLQNDYLTLKFADKRDIWLHTKKIPGSHVIIKNFGTVPDKTLEEAAMLAAYYSKAKGSSKVAVDYTSIKNIHKPNGAKPGMVIYYTNKTLYVDSSMPSIEQIE